MESCQKVQNVPGCGRKSLEISVENETSRIQSYYIPLERKFQAESKSLNNLYLEMKWTAVKRRRTYPGVAENPWKYKQKMKHLEYFFKSFLVTHLQKSSPDVCRTMLPARNVLSAAANRSMDERYVFSRKKRIPFLLRVDFCFIPNPLGQPQSSPGVSNLSKFRLIFITLHTCGAKRR